MNENAVEAECSSITNDPLWPCEVAPLYKPMRSTTPHGSSGTFTFTFTSVDWSHLRFEISVISELPNGMQDALGEFDELVQPDERNEFGAS